VADCTVLTTTALSCSVVVPRRPRLRRRHLRRRGGSGAVHVASLSRVAVESPLLRCDSSPCCTCRCVRATRRDRVSTRTATVALARCSRCWRGGGTPTVRAEPRLYRHPPSLPMSRRILGRHRLLSAMTRMWRRCVIVCGSGAMTCCGSSCAASCQQQRGGFSGGSACCSSTSTTS
jgi:hypothetical protein